MRKADNKSYGLIEPTKGIIYVKVSVIAGRVMTEAVLQRLGKKVDAISEFLEDIYLTKEEEERLKKADELIEKGKLQRG